MRVLVLGGGVIGVTVAYYLTEAGHEVELVERRAAAAMETSFANAGEVRRVIRHRGPGLACRSR